MLFNSAVSIRKLKSIVVERNLTHTRLGVVHIKQPTVRGGHCDVANRGKILEVLRIKNFTRMIRTKGEIAWKRNSSAQS